jgi:hypothetical protein
VSVAGSQLDLGVVDAMLEVLTGRAGTTVA